jgi:hypothetical protein
MQLKGDYLMLVFQVNQTHQIACQLFQAVWGKLGSKRNLWEQMRALFYEYKFDSMEDILRALFYGFKMGLCQIIYPAVLYG